MIEEYKQYYIRIKQEEAEKEQIALANKSKQITEWKKRRGKPADRKRFAIFFQWFEIQNAKK